MYILGATVWPELPTWRSMGSHPLSQIGREAASSAPSASASFCTIGMFSASLIPRPTDTMISARAVDLTAADIIVSVGRGIKEAENIPIVQKLADALGAGPAGPRPSRDNGWRPGGGAS